MVEMSLQEIKETGYHLLLFLKDYCEANHLQYYLSNGTLLGAVKYGGYIPWDDDVDIAMPRDDYDRFVRDFIDTDHVKLLSHERNEQYGFPFSKLCDARTLKVEKHQPIDKGLDQGVCVDVFPIDSFSNNKTVAKLQAKLSWAKITFYHLSQIEHYERKHPLKRLLYRGARIIGYRRLQRWILKEPTDRKKSSKYVGNRVWTIYGSREVLRAVDFSEAKEAEFENAAFLIPAGYHNYLSSLYGDYRKDPPISEQKTHHSYKAYWI